MRRLLGLCSACLLLAVPVMAQTQEPVVSWEIRVFLAGVNPDTGAPVQTATFAKATSACNQPKVTLPIGPIVNPARIIVDDPDLPLRDCVLGPNAGGTLTSLPFGVAHVATAVARGATLASPRSAASNPFDRVAPAPLPPSVPTGLRVAP